MNVFYSLQHLGYTIPPQADAGWIGPAGAGPSYLDPRSGGPENDFTNRNTTSMTYNLLHLLTAINAPNGMRAADPTSPTPNTGSPRFAAWQRVRLTSLSN